MTAPTLLGDDLTSNRFSGLPANRLQIVLFYDGQGEATFGFEYKDPSGTVGWINIPGIPTFNRIITKEYDLRGCTLTGNFVVEGAVPNGVVDGLAFGLLWRDDQQGYHILRSNAPHTVTTAPFVSAWPLGMNHSTFASRAPQLTDWCARETAFAVVSGAKLLPSGKYRIDVL
ncbi:hypothetical protein [Paraliomyxa miuraensis]|uniref:hypothetical protein n=1 Tax=Paraliomyxa miuraensis TaxID=376150 RepID=UPI002256E736|nr:hypothetical protein [Paraliomyxa miuraensis]MCX4244787.1 hypothetical protein [Paraliomyxa miuraensis]